MLSAVAVVLCAAWLLAVAWLSAHAHVNATGPASIDELLALVAASVAMAIAAWLCLGTALEVLSHVPGGVGRAAGYWADRLTPAAARRLSAFLLGVGVGVAGGPSQAMADPPAPVVAGAPADPGLVAGAPLPDPAFDALVAPAAPAEPGFTPAPAEPGFTPGAPRVRPQPDPALLGAHASSDRTRHSDSDHLVVVHRGDSLWSIADRHLGPDATDAEIARAWPLWFEANRDRIGDDPDLILPGQILRVPDADQAQGLTVSPHP